jgi:hypothetical protein
MKPIEIRNENWNSIKGRLSGQRQQVYEALICHGCATTKQLADRSGISLLTLRPRLTELCQLGIAECIGRDGHDGRYRAVPLELAQQRFEAAQRAVRSNSNWQRSNPMAIPPSVHPSLKPGQPIRITPDLAVLPHAPLAAVPAFGLVEWVRTADGKFEARLITHDQWIALSRYPADQIGLPISRDTLLRLGRAGFIRMRRPTPFEWQYHLGSLIEHLEAAEEEDFWDETNIKRYREALA